MATSTDTKNKNRRQFETPFTAFEAPFAPLEAISEQLIEGARKAGTRYLDAYQQATSSAIALERKLAANSRQEWLSQVLEAHAELSEELVAAYSTAARTLLAS
jgi:phosphoglycerate-specific signal transduction histidine kinase